MEEGEGQREGGGGGVGGATTTSPLTHNPPTTPPTPRTIRENLANLLELKKVHEERLQRIEEELSHLHRFKKDYEQLYKRLKSLPDKTQHEVMVPLGRLALMPGQLVHTNEVLVLLGDNWFAERSARQATEIVRRRVKDCEEKIRSAENNRRIHTAWLSEAQELLSGEEGQQVEILEELTEEEYQRSKEEHRRRVAEEYTRLREAAPKQQPQRPQSPPNPPSPPAPPDPFLEGLGEGERQNYEELMRRLDQLELEEMGEAMDPLEEAEEEEEDEDVDDDEEEEEEEEGEDERQKIIPSPQTKNRKLKFRRRLKSADNDDGVDLGRRWRKGLIGGTASMDNTDTASDSDTDRGDIAGALGKRQARLRRRVSWADDIRPLYTIIPDDTSEEVHRIPYTSTPAVSDAPAETPHPSKPANLPLEAVESTQTDLGDIQSPSDLYRVFGHSATEGSQPPASSLPPTAPSSAPPVPGLAPGTPPPRSILKKSKSLPVQGDDGEDAEAGSVGWCCPPKPLDLEDEEDEGEKVGGDGEKGVKFPTTPPPPPSPPPKRAGSFKSAFTYRVLEHSAAAAGDGDTPAPPKKISKFRAARTKN